MSSTTHSPSLSQETPMNISFSGCGFLGIYHVGVATAIREYAPHLLLNRICGASAGALAASALICDCCLGQATTDFLKAVIQARARALGPLHPSFNLVKILRDGLRNNLPPDAHRKASGRLHISLTRFSDGKNILVTQFDSKEDLIQALICSAFIPFYCGTIPPMYKGVRYIDGGWSDNMPILDDHTITVSPFSGETDICPSDADSASLLSFSVMNTSLRFTARNLYRVAVALFPPHPEILSDMCRQGFEDGLRFLAKNNLISCTRCLAVQSSIALSSNTQRGLEAVQFGFGSEADILFGEDSELNTCEHYHGETREEKQSTTKRKRCETCTQLETEVSNLALPTIVRKRLKDAEQLDKTISGYLMSTLPGRMVRYLSIPWFLPWDLTVAMATKVLDLLPTLPEDSFVVAERATRGVRFLLARALDEIELRGQRYARSEPVSCQLSVTEMNLSCEPMGPPMQMPDVVPKEERKSRHGSLEKLNRLRVKKSNTPSAQCDVTEMKFQFQFDADPQSKSLCTLKQLVQSDSSDLQSPVQAEHVCKAAEDFGLRGIRNEDLLDVPLKRKGSSRSIDAMSVRSAPLSGLSDDVDTVTSVLEFVRRHEALMSFYYLDSQEKKIKIHEIHRVQPCEDEQRSNTSTTSSGSQKKRWPLSPVQSMSDTNILEEKEPAKGISRRQTVSGAGKVRKMFGMFKRRASADKESASSNSGSEQELFKPRRMKKKSEKEDEYDAESSN